MTDDPLVVINRLLDEIHQMKIEIMYLKGEISDNERARLDSPAVKEAWEQYQIVLKLTKK